MCSIPGSILGAEKHRSVLLQEGCGGWEGVGYASQQGLHVQREHQRSAGSAGARPGTLHQPGSGGVPDECSDTEEETSQGSGVPQCMDTSAPVPKKVVQTPRTLRKGCWRDLDPYSTWTQVPCDWEGFSDPEGH